MLGSSRYLRPGLSAFGLGLLVALVLGIAPLARADTAPGLVVTDEGPGVVNTAGVTAVVGGTCADVYEAEQANGKTLCPAASWPDPGTWGSPTLAMDEGDVLRLTFSVPVSDVTYASTTNYPAGLTNPDGTSVPNVNIIAPVSATPTANPKVWNAPIPNPLSPLAASAVPFAVVAQDATEDHDYSLTIQKPYCVEPGTVLTPGTFTCPIPPGGGTLPGRGTPKSTSPGEPSQESTSKSAVVRIVSVRRQGNHRYRVTVSVSGPGHLVLTWFEHTHRIAQFSRSLTTDRATFDVRVMSGRHVRLKIDATFRSKDGNIAKPVTVFAES